jgi:hypothetical protein
VALSPLIKVVQLKGNLLFVVLAFGDACLSTAPSLDVGFPHAFDNCGNVVLFEPTSLELTLPDGWKYADSPRSAPAVQRCLSDGKCVVAFFRSGGFIAAQLGHHWHAVTPSDPEDIIDDVVRIAGIGYPQRAAIVSGYATEEQRTSCTTEASHRLASALMNKAEQ